jgi:hypothetical protein
VGKKSPCAVAQQTQWNSVTGNSPLFARPPDDATDEEIRDFARELVYGALGEPLPDDEADDGE